MKNIQRAITLSALFVFLTVSSALGQSGGQTVVNIPFNFVVGEKIMPAGKYVIQRNKRDSDTAWTIEQRGGGAAAVLLTATARHTESQDETKLIFSKYEDVYFLTSFSIIGGTTERKVPMSNRERTLEKTLAQAGEKIVVTELGK